MKMIHHGRGPVGQVVTPGYPIRFVRSGGAPAPVDEFWANVVLLAANDNAAEGSTTFLDQGPLALSLARGSVAAYDGVAPPGMVTSIALNGTSWVRLPVVSGSELTLGGDFTVEATVRLNGNDADSAVLAYNLVTSPNVNIQFKLNVPGVGYFRHYNATDGVKDSISGAIGWNNVWAHLAFVRSGSGLSFYYNGIKVNDSVPSTGIIALSNQVIGAALSSGAYVGSGLSGNIACLRITKGHARYLTDFTPAALPYPKRGPSA